ncbi:MAG: carbohydrate-binding protein [Chthoniobacterales bacterium]
MNKIPCLFLAASASILSLAAAQPYAGKPYNAQPLAVPGTLQAEQYDISPNAANDVTFHYNGTPKKSPNRTSPDSIMVAGFGGGHVSTDGKPEDPKQVYVGWTQSGEWLNYTVKVAQPGTYIFGGKFSAGNKGAKVSATFTPLDKYADANAPKITTGPVEIPTTAGFQPGVEVYHVWETLDKLAEVKLPAGTYVLTIKIESPVAGMNFDNFTFTKKP